MYAQKYDCIPEQMHSGCRQDNVYLVKNISPCVKYV